MAFTKDNYPWSVEGLQRCIESENLNAKIIAINGEMAIVKVNDYKASQILGAVSDWCISQHSCSWEQYVSKDGNIQLFFYNFNLRPDNYMSLVGATFTMRKDLASMKLMCCFTRENHPISEKIKKKNCDLEALNKLIAIPNFGLTITENNNPLFDALVKDVKESNIFSVSENSWGKVKPYVEHPVRPVRSWGDFFDEDDDLFTEEEFDYYLNR